MRFDIDENQEPNRFILDLDLFTAVSNFANFTVTNKSKRLMLYLMVQIPLLKVSFILMVHSCGWKISVYCCNGDAIIGELVK